MVWVGRDLKDHLVPTPCPGQGHLPLDQVAQSRIQPGLESFQGGGSHSFFGQPVPVPHHPHSSYSAIWDEIQFPKWRLPVPFKTPCVA